MNVTLPYPTTCPACGTPTVVRLPHLLCGNPTCPEKIIGVLVNAAKRSNLDITGLGEEVATALVHNKYVQTLPDLFMLSEHDLSSLPFKKGSFGEAQAKKLFTTIHKTKLKPWNVVLHSLGCPGLGEPEADKIAEQYGLYDLLNLPGAELKMRLMNIKGVGEVTAINFVEWLRLSARWLKELLNEGLQVTPLVVDAGSQPLLGYTVVITGNFGEPRDIVEAKLKKLGAKVTGSVSKKTTVVLVGQSPGAEKTSKAAELGVPTGGQELLEQLLSGEACNLVSLAP